MKILFSLIIVAILLNANTTKLIIDSDKFESNDKKGTLIFTDNVKMRKAQDRLNANKITVFLNEPIGNKKREAIKYIASGEVTFKIFLDEKHYEGSGDEVIYMPKELSYEILGNGYLKDITTNRTLIGEKIFIDQKNGDAVVEGGEDKPVRFIFDLEEKKEKNSENN